ncbi:hypothetical protein D4764_09G0004740 [Takifugu flavidus]|uniref:Uncharacterized protein n=1 Tax=Takifugu flavidus TaxID=433684 RepID=A0A5C6MLA3_9TELE|nr:hypothetical protein D4764_09G0004740 [Takifugu flavidus]
MATFTERRGENTANANEAALQPSVSLRREGKRRKQEEEEKTGRKERGENRKKRRKQEERGENRKKRKRRKQEERGENRKKEEKTGRRKEEKTGRRRRERGENRKKEERRRNRITFSWQMAHQDPLAPKTRPDLLLHLKMLSSSRRPRAAHLKEKPELEGGGGANDHLCGRWRMPAVPGLTSYPVSSSNFLFPLINNQISEDSRQIAQHLGSNEKTPNFCQYEDL